MGNKNSIIVGISGPIAAGKTTLALAFKIKGFAYTRFSLVIDDELRRLQKLLNRRNRQALGRKIHRSGRQGWLAERTLARVGSAPFIVVDGLRFPEDHAFLAEHADGKYLHVFVDADEIKRRNRYSVRESDIDFDRAENSEVEGQITNMRSLAHRSFLNNGNIADIESWIDNLAVQNRKGVILDIAVCQDMMLDAVNREDMKCQSQS